ncbi:fructose-bisphosphate aldolase-lysine N-methyltransferase, chloroplastic-like [Chenopodium quinoa]|uniref:SET domain-containing protein n=1 Tax=Chenopodium quinoa TaxID=63459 RepID=A0A803L1U5_CHEQI|nr:fructose-bisphosphate aldolase-lysine N-methyltransferase, chloroplastic-like [Chenopodium quinoa]
MATLFTLTPSSKSSFFTPFKTTLNSKPHFPTLRNPLSIRCFRPPETDTPPELKKFWGWLSDKGIVSAKCPVKPGIVTEGLGLVAQKDIARNEVVLEVSKKFWINPDTVAASEIGSVCNGLKPWVSVALFLMREKKLGDSSAWKPYIDILPDSTNSTIYWSEEELSKLQGSQLLNTTLGVKELVANEFAKLEEEVIVPNKRLFPFDITLDDFLWAFGMLRSRAFTRLEGQSLVLIPMADLINHSPDITAQDYAWEVKGAGLFSRELLFSLRNPIQVKAGGQVLIQYDLNKSNAELALDYGFTESRSERNAYTLTLEIPESDPFFADKLDIAESNGIGETAYFDIVLDQPLPAIMLPYLRLLALGGDDAFLLESIFRNSIWGHLDLPVSPANEELICQVIRNACTSALSGYSTTIEEDEKLLAQGDLDPRLEIAITIRLGEKKVLQQIDEVFKERETELGGFEYYQERRLKDLGLAGAQGEKLPWIGEV